MFPLLGQYVCVDLANSVFLHSGRPYDALEAEAQEWLDAVADLRLADGGTLAEATAGRLRVDEALQHGLIDLRSDVRDLLIAGARAETPRAATMKRLNALSAAAPSRLHAIGVDGSVVLQRQRPGPAPAAILAALAEDAFALAGDGTTATRLFQCASHGCIGVLLRDDPRREYCSDRCATRDRVARHARRAKGE
ncbi:MAG: ABATE domain-containing protein [Sporichthyaceae bacterium]